MKSLSKKVLKLATILSIGGCANPNSLKSNQDILIKNTPIPISSTSNNIVTNVATFTAPIQSPSSEQVTTKTSSSSLTTGGSVYGTNSSMWSNGTTYGDSNIETTNFGYAILKKTDDNNMNIFYNNKEIGSIKKIYYTNPNSNDKFVILSGSISYYPSNLIVKFKNNNFSGKYMTQRVEDNFFEFIYKDDKEEKNVIPIEVNWVSNKVKYISKDIPILEINIDINKLI